MGYRPDFKNAFSPLGRGLQQVGQRVAGYFSQKAQENFQLGVREITQAEEAMKEIKDRRANADFAPSPEVSAALNSLYAYYDQIANMSPYQAREYVANNPPPQGVSVRSIAGKPAQPGRETAATRQGRMSAGAPPQAATPDRREVTNIPSDQFLGNIDRETAQRTREFELSTEDRLARRDFGFQRLLNSDGDDADIRLAELQNAHQIRMQEGEQAFADEMARLARLHDVDLAELQAGFDEASDRRLFEQQFSITEFNAYTSAVDAAIELKKTDPELANSRLEALANNTSLPDFVRSQAESALDVDYSALNESLIAGWERDLALAEDDETRSELDLERTRAEIRLANRSVTIAGQEIAMNDLKLDGEELVNARMEFENADLANMSARDFIESAVTLGMPARIASLMNARNNPDDPLHAMAMRVRPNELTEAYQLAIEAKDLAGRQNTVMEAQLDDALEQLGSDSLQRKTELISTIGSIYDSDQILALAENDPKVRTLIQNGLLTQSDLQAAVSTAEFREALESDQVNGRRVEIALDSLNQYANPESFIDPDSQESWDQATSGLRSTLQGLVDMGYMEPGAVPGLVEMYQAGWRNGQNSYEMEKALNNAQIGVYNSQASKNLSGDGEGDAPLDPSVVNAMVNMLDKNIDNVRSRNPNCFDPDSGIPLDTPDCGETRAEYTYAQNQFKDFMNETLGYTPDASAIPNMNEGELLAYANFFLNKPTLTDQERMLFIGVTQAFGGEDALMEALGVEQPVDPNAWEPGAPGVGTPAPGWEPRTGEETPAPGAPAGQALPSDADTPIAWGLTPAQVTSVLDSNSFNGVPFRVRNTIFNKANSEGVDTSDAQAVLEWFRGKAGRQ